ncbi:hypothetical protein B0H11DRAFT_1931900 [Mycena galericulata]|nr:hypothetical protein B0H11DRAFT_1931900 [Mycena galericulata]
MSLHFMHCPSARRERILHRNRGTSTCSTWFLGIGLAADQYFRRGQPPGVIRRPLLFSKASVVHPDPLRFPSTHPSSADVVWLASFHGEPPSEGGPATRAGERVAVGDRPSLLNMSLHFMHCPSARRERILHRNRGTSTCSAWFIGIGLAADRYFRRYFPGKAIRLVGEPSKVARDVWRETYTYGARYCRQNASNAPANHLKIRVLLIPVLEEVHLHPFKNYDRTGKKYLERKAEEKGANLKDKILGTEQRRSSISLGKFSEGFGNNNATAKTRWPPSTLSKSVTPHLSVYRNLTRFRRTVSLYEQSGSKGPSSGSNESISPDLQVDHKKAIVGLFSADSSSTLPNFNDTHSKYLTMFLVQAPLPYHTQSAHALVFPTSSARSWECTVSVLCTIVGTILDKQLSCGTPPKRHGLRGLAYGIILQIRPLGGVRAGSVCGIFVVVWAVLSVLAGVGLLDIHLLEKRPDLSTAEW